VLSHLALGRDLAGGGGLGSPGLGQELLRLLEHDLLRLVRPDRSRQALGNRRPGLRRFLGEDRGVELVQAAEQDDAAVTRARDRVASARLEHLAGRHLAQEVDRQPRAIGPLDHLACRHDPRLEDGQVVLQRSSKADLAPRAAGAHRSRARVNGVWLGPRRSLSSPLRPAAQTVGSRGE